ncbi:MAG: helix-turn-helix domain-containing protein [Candidatus Methanosuratincola petrocarbonis]
MGAVCTGRRGGGGQGGQGNELRAMGAYQALKEAGLTDYEALAYLGLVFRGPTTAKALSDSTGIPHTRVYDVLGELERRGWVEVDASRPMRFRAKPPPEVVGVVRAEQQQRLGRVEEILIKDLLPVYETKGAESTEIWFIRSVPGMVNRIRSLVSSAKKELRLMMGHFEAEVYGRVIGEISETAKRKRVRAFVSEDVAQALSGTGIQGAEIMIGAAVAPFNIILSDSGEVLFHLWSGLDGPPERRRNFMVYVSDSSIEKVIRDYIDALFSAGQAGRTPPFSRPP